MKVVRRGKKPTGLEAGVLGEPAAVPNLRLDLRGRVVVRSGHPVLLDDEPARIAVELCEEPGQVDVSSPELAEDAAAPRLDPRPVQPVEADVLDVEVLDALAPVPEGDDGIAAGRE